MKKIFNLILCFFFIILFYSETLKAAEIEILLDIPGSGEIIKNHSKVSVHYRGFLEDGTEFDSSIRRGRPSNFAPNQVIRGWTEAMQLMREGDEWELYIPSELGYGNSNRGQYIKAGDVLIFTLNLI